MERLAATRAGFGAGYLLTTSSDGRVKVVTVEPAVEGAELVIAGVSGGSAANLAGNPAATVVFPPIEARGYSLIVDGTGAVQADAIRIRAASAVLHRPAAHGVPKEGPGCGQDCREV